MPEPVAREPIGSRIQYLRERKGWTLSDLSRQSGVSRSYLYQLEQGGSAPTQETIQKLADAFGVLVSELLGERPQDISVPDSLRQFAEQASLVPRDIRML